VLVRDIVAAHGGRVEVESDPVAHGRGTTVRLTLPAVGTHGVTASPSRGSA
jgi:signal transduction histidine kinase